MKTLIHSIFIFFLFLLINLQVVSQDHPNSLYFEAFGNGLFYSANYDKLFNKDYSVRIGFMYLPSFDVIFRSVDNIILIPFMLNYLKGRKHIFEIGAGIVFVNIERDEIFGFNMEGGSGVIGTATIGYRYQKPEGGFLWRIGFTPLFNNEGIQPSGGVSLGYSF